MKTTTDYNETSVAELGDFKHKVDEQVDCPGETHCLPNISASVSDSVSIILTSIAVFRLV